MESRLQSHSITAVPVSQASDTPKFFHFCPQLLLLLNPISSGRRRRNLQRVIQAVIETREHFKTTYHHLAFAVIHRNFNVFLSENLYNFWIRELKFSLVTIELITINHKAPLVRTAASTQGKFHVRVVYNCMHRARNITLCEVIHNIFPVHLKNKSWTRS